MRPNWRFADCYSAEKYVVTSGSRWTMAAQHNDEAYSPISCSSRLNNHVVMVGDQTTNWVSNYQLVVPHRKSKRGEKEGHNMTKRVPRWEHLSFPLPGEYAWLIHINANQTKKIIISPFQWRVGLHVSVGISPFQIMAVTNARARRELVELVVWTGIYGSWRATSVLLIWYFGRYWSVCFQYLPYHYRQ